jgi:flagellar hook-associated protein 2
MSSISSTGSTSTNLLTTTGSTSGTSTSTSGSSSSGTTSISGTGLLSSLGLGSGLDVTSIINALVNAKQAGPKAQIAAQTAQDQNQVAGLTGLGTALSALQSALSELTSSTTYTTYNATLSNTAVGTASTLPNATPGTYDINVGSLAAAQKRLSGAFSSTATVGTGTLNISVGSNTIAVPVSSTDTLSSIATSINNAANNPGVSATVVVGTSGSQLVLTSTKTGVANAFSISASSDSSSGVSSLATSLNTAGSSEASDASLTIDGIAVTSASNQVSGALTGVTLNLAATGTSTLTVAQDTSPISSAVNDFVTAYNSYASMIGTLSSYDPTSGTAGVLLGDTTLASIQRQVSSLISSSVSGNSIGTLANLGITRNADGTMSLDASTLATALSSNPSAVQGLFSGTNGLATQLNNTVNNYTSSDGILQTRITSLNANLTSLQTETTALNQRMSVYQQQLAQQYTALGTLISSLNNTSSYLTQSLAALNDSSSKS